MPMKWHNFLCKFLLWLGVAANCYSAYVMLSGKAFGENSDLVFAYIPSLKTVCTVFGILLIGVIILGIVTAISLIKMKAIAPKLVILYYVVTCLMSIAVNLVCYFIVKKELPSADCSQMIYTAIGYGVVGLIMIIANKIYYGKREDMFVN